VEKFLEENFFLLSEFPGPSDFTFYIFYLGSFPGFYSSGGPRGAESGIGHRPNQPSAARRIQQKYDHFSSFFQLWG